MTTAILVPHNAWQIAIAVFGALTIGLVLGQAVQWHKTKSGTRSLEFAPHVMRNVVIVVAVIACLSMFQSAVAQYRQARCNAEFRETIALRSEASSKQTEANAALMRRLIELPENADNQEARNKARENYIAAVQNYIITAHNNPYPDPRC
jgi:hypothetical protein